MNITCCTFFKGKMSKNFTAPFYNPKKCRKYCFKITPEIASEIASKVVPEIEGELKSWQKDGGRFLDTRSSSCPA